MKGNNNFLFRSLMMLPVSGELLITESQNFIVPPSASILKVICIGGGGGGGGYQYQIAGNGGATSFGEYCTAPGGFGGKGGGDSSYSGYAGASGGNGTATGAIVLNYPGSSVPYGSNGTTAGKWWNPTSSDWSLGNWSDTTYGTSGTGYNARDGSGASGTTTVTVIYGLIPGIVIPVTIGMGGAGSGTGYHGRRGSDGSAGCVYVQWTNLI